MKQTQLNLFDALASLNPQLVVEMEAEPGWIWARCRVCDEVRYLRRADAGAKCVMTPACQGRMEKYLECVCGVCGKPVTRRRLGKDIEYCSKKCEDSGVSIDLVENGGVG